AYVGQDLVVHFNLGRYATGPDGEHRIWTYPLRDLGAPSTLLDELDHFSLPLQLVQGLREELVERSVAADQPLWLDLIRPYGFLGVLPWEQTLGTILGRPILRLPSFVEPPQADEDVADLAVLVGTPPACDRRRTVWQVRSVVDAILQG